MTQRVISCEQELWRKFQQGDEKALAAIYSAYFSRLYNYGFKFTSDANLVEDCIQELFIKLIRNRRNLALPDLVKNYLFTAFRSFLFDRLKKLTKSSLQELEESHDFNLEPNRESEMIQGEEVSARVSKLKAGLEQLTPRQREAIFLKYEEGFSYPEIAQTLAMSQKAAYKLVGRALQVLRAVALSGFLTGLFFIL